MLGETGYHAFANLSKGFKWDKVKAKLEEMKQEGGDSATKELVNIMPAGRWSALHQAAMETGMAGNKVAQKRGIKAMEDLLSYGADPSLMNNKGETALMVFEDYVTKSKSPSSPPSKPGRLLLLEAELKYNLDPHAQPDNDIKVYINDGNGYKWHTSTARPHQIEAFTQFCRLSSADQLKGYNYENKVQPGEPVLIKFDIKRDKMGSMPYMIKDDHKKTMVPITDNQDGVRYPIWFGEVQPDPPDTEGALPPNGWLCTDQCIAPESTWPSPQSSRTTYVYLQENGDAIVEGRHGITRLVRISGIDLNQSKSIVNDPFKNAFYPTNKLLHYSTSTYDGQIYQPDQEGTEIMREIRNPDIAKGTRQLFVLPSQLNGAEYGSYDDGSIVERVDEGSHHTNYLGDDTGGPRGQLACSLEVAQVILKYAANSVHPYGINYVRNIIDDIPNITLVNGYLKIGNEITESDVKKFSDKLGLMECLASEDNPVTGYNPDKQYTEVVKLSSGPLFGDNTKRVDLIYTSAVPIGYSFSFNAYQGDPAGENEYDRHLRKIAQLVIYGQYVCALKYACKRAGDLKERENLKVYQVNLMPLGGGVFNNRREDIMNAICHAIHTVGSYPNFELLELKLVLFDGCINPVRINKNGKHSTRGDYWRPGPRKFGSEVTDSNGDQESYGTILHRLKNGGDSQTHVSTGKKARVVQSKPKANKLTLTRKRSPNSDSRGNRSVQRRRNRSGQRRRNRSGQRRRNRSGQRRRNRSGQRRRNISGQRRRNRSGQRRR